MLPSHMLVCSLPLCANRFRSPAPFPSFCISHTNSSPWRLHFFSMTSNRGNLQALCFYNFATVPGAGRGGARGGKVMLEPWRSQIANQKALTRLECAVEHPTKDASPACPEPRRREGVSRPKDLNVQVSPLECAVTQNATLSALECAVAKMRPCNP